MSTSFSLKASYGVSVYSGLLMKFDSYSESQIIIIYSSFSAGCDNSLIDDNHHFCILGKEKVKHCIWLVNSLLMNKACFIIKQ